MIDREKIAREVAEELNIAILDNGNWVTRAGLNSYVMPVGAKDHISRMRDALIDARCRIVELETAIRWALGEDESGFRARRDGEGAYWWRTELRKRTRLAVREKEPKV